MRAVKIIIVEDELIIAESLRIMLESSGYEVTAIFTSGVETLQEFKSEMADIIFMDIQLAGKTNGVDTAIQLKKITDAPVIYITNNVDERIQKKAINEGNTVHYLTKPFNKPDILVAIQFALKAIKSNEFKVSDASQDGYLLNDSIFLKNGLGFKKIMVSDIMFLEADGSYCKFNFKGGKTQVFSDNLSYYGDKLSFAADLMRIHRSYIVNVNYIERVHENRIWINGLEIPISKSYKAEFSAKFRFI